MRVAIVNDWLANMGGAERVLLAVHELYPDAPVFCTVANHSVLSSELRSLDIRTSFIQRMPFSRRKYQFYLPFVPLAVEQFDLSRFDVVVSLSFCAAKGVITRPDTTHICYCHTPMRYAWDMFHDYRDQERITVLTRLIMAPMMNYLRVWDYASAARVDFFAANSTTVARRLRKYYRRDSTVIPPPVDVELFSPDGSGPGEYYLYVSRLVRYKRADLAVEAFNHLERPLLIVGDGPEKQRLKRIARSNVKFLGRVADEELARLYRGCRALIFPQEEDFGIVPVEAQACGRPVIAYGAGGALDTVRPESTGLFFQTQDWESLRAAVLDFETREFDARAIREHACSFSRDVFKASFMDFVKRCYQTQRADELCSGQPSFRKQVGIADGTVDRHQSALP